MIWLQVFFAMLAGINTAAFVAGGASYNAGLAVTVGLMALVMRGEKE
jgi:hypothetical protein